MKIVHYATAAALAIGLCATQCRGDCICQGADNIFYSVPKTESSCDLTCAKLTANSDGCTKKFQSCTCSNGGESGSCRAGKGLYCVCRHKLTADKWINQHVSKITDNDQKVLLASWLYWNIKVIDAGLTEKYAAHQGSGQKSKNDAGAGETESSKARKAKDQADIFRSLLGDKMDDIARKAKEAVAYDVGDLEDWFWMPEVDRGGQVEDSLNHSRRSIYGNFYVALWNKDDFGKKILATKEVMGAKEVTKGIVEVESARIKFPAPENGEIKPLYP